MDAHETQVRYNAGVDIALHINGLFKMCGVYAARKDFASWHDKLREIHRWISPKVSGRKEAFVELQESSDDKYETMAAYQRKIGKNKKMPASITYQLFNYLSAYEMSLRKWSDKLGYGMPEADDIASAAFR